MREKKEADLLLELAPVAEQLLERHLSTAREWFPHEFVPWSRGRDFVEGERFDDDDLSLPAPVRSALFVNLLTEDNLPYYFSALEGYFGKDHPWREWTRRWTAEEMRHGTVIRDYLTVTRAIDMITLERARMEHVSTGWYPDAVTPPEALVYVTLQELATRIAHRNTGMMMDDGAGRAIMQRVAGDENLHYLFYRRLVESAIEVDPSAMVIAMDKEVRRFGMPGTGIRNFSTHAKAIAGAGIYSVAIFREQVVMPVLLNYWRLESLERLSPEAEQARDRVVNYIEKLGRVAARLSSAAPAPDPAPATA